MSYKPDEMEVSVDKEVAATFIDAKFISDNPVPRCTGSLQEMVAWFNELWVAEEEAS